MQEIHSFGILFLLRNCPYAQINDNLLEKDQDEGRTYCTCILLIFL